MTESKRVWDYKPWWCQPWSIVLTGIGAIAGSWFLFKLLWLTIPIALLVGIWMGFFLVVYPQAFQKWLEDQDVSA